MNIRKLVPLLWITMIAIAAVLISPQPAAAQAAACSVSVSLTATATGSSSCFVPAGLKSYAIMTGTWVGTVHVQASYDGGTNWVMEEQTTANTSFTLGIKPRARRVRAYFSSRTSGTLTGSVIFNPITANSIKYTAVPIGSVAYGSFGTNGAITGSTTSHVIDIHVTETFVATGIGILNGATVGTNKHCIALYDSSGGLVANTAVAGTLTAGANAFQQVAFTSKVTLAPGIYYVFLQMDGTTDTIRTVATSTFVNRRAGTITSTVFGTIPLAIAPPTTFTADKGPISYVY